MNSANKPNKLALNQETLRLLNVNPLDVPNFGTNLRTQCVQCDTLQLGCTI
jgi:hypothetical protein